MINGRMLSKENMSLGESSSGNAQHKALVHSGGVHGGHYYSYIRPTFFEQCSPMISCLDIVASFKTIYYISGIAPFGDSLVVLAYILGDEDNGKKKSVALLPHDRVSIS